MLLQHSNRMMFRSGWNSCLLVHQGKKQNCRECRGPAGGRFDNELTPTGRKLFILFIAVLVLTMMVSATA